MSSDRIWILLGKKKNGEASEQEIKELEQLLSSDNDPTYSIDIIEKIWDVPLVFIPGPTLPDNTWNQILGNLNTADKRNIPLYYIGWKKWFTAACLLIAVGALVFEFTASNKNTPVFSPQEGKMSQVSTQQGTKTKIVLADGTMVWLNANSQLTYGNKNFGTDNREVYLSGEAFFDVTKNEKVPFIIHTGAINITVKGTAFNVRAYPGEHSTETSLIRGLVEITTHKDPTRKIILKPNEKIIIPVDEPDYNDQQSSHGPSAGASIYTIMPLKKDSSQVLAETVWLKDKLEFDNEVFEKLAPKIENWFGIKIHFLDEEIKQRRFSGVIEKETLTDMLEAMQLSCHFSYQIKGKELWISKK